MEEKCFCHFNGYEVKDAKARRSVEQLKGEMDAQTAEYEALQKNVHSKTSEMQKEVEAAFSAAQQAARDAAEAKKRADQMSTMEEGSTTGDAELQDIRIGSDGVTYSNAGSAVRSVGRKLGILLESFPMKQSIYHIENMKWYYVNHTMGMTTPMYAENDILVECPSNYKFRVLYFSSADPSSYESMTEYMNRFVIPAGVYFDFHMQNSEATEITPEEAYNLTARYVYTMPEVDSKIEATNKKIATIANENKFLIDGDWEFGALFQANGLENNTTSAGGYIRTGFIGLYGIEGTVVLDIVNEAYDGGGYWQARVYQYDENKSFLKVTQKLKFGTYTIALEPETKYIRLMCGNYEEEDLVTLENGNDILLYKLNPMVDEIKKISAVAGGTVYEDEVNATVAGVQEALRSIAGTDEAYTFAIFTDLHHDPENPMDPMNDMFANMKALHDRLHFDAIFNLGDSIDGAYYNQVTAEKYHAAVKAAARAITPNYYALEGNHDNNVQSTWESKGGLDAAEKLTERELYAVMQKGSPNMVRGIFAPEQMDPARQTDFYVDFGTLRIICISAEYTTYKQETAQWLQYVLDECLGDNGKSVLILSHCAARQELGFNNDIKNGDWIENCIWDFLDNDGMLVGYFNGHTHGDIMLDLEVNGDYEYKNLSIGCAKFEQLSSGTDGATYQPRNANDHTKVLFDVVTVNPDNGNVWLHRFGAGDDRYYSY